MKGLFYGHIPDKAVSVLAVDGSADCEPADAVAELGRHVPGYTEPANFVNAPADRSRELITAGGPADVEFARERRALSASISGRVDASLVV